MKRSLLVVLLVCYSLLVSAQVNFDPGYFVDNDGNRTDCLIKNSDGLFNPTEFEYRLTPGSEVHRGTLQTVKEFGITTSNRRYQRFTLRVDMSSTNQKIMSASYGPDFSEAQLFLRVMVQGQATLYAYIAENGIEKYFLKVGDNEVEQLLYKQYLDSRSIRENVTFKQQLFMAMKCDRLDKNRFVATQYNERSLVSVFSDYNECVGSASATHFGPWKKGMFELKIRAGLGSAGLEVRQSRPLYVNAFKPEIFPLAGFDVSYKFPFNNGKWSIFLQPTWQLFKTGGSFLFYHQYTPRGERNTMDIQYNHITLTLGARHDFFVGPQSGIYVNAGLGYNMILGPGDTYTVGNFRFAPVFQQTSFSIAPCLLVGLGYRYNDRLSVDVDYTINKILYDDSDWQANVKTPLSLAVGYRLVGSRR